jgi:hypothetical protein
MSDQGMKLGDLMPVFMKTDTLGEESYISSDLKLQSWELIRLVAKRGNDLVTQIVKQADKLPVQEDYVNFQHTLEKITDSIICALKFLEAYCCMFAEFRTGGSPELEEKYGSMQSFDDTLSKAWNDYMAYAETAKRLASEMCVRVLESNKNHA